MRGVVLVHGGFHGGWCWQKVTDLLRRQDVRVFAPSLTGMGDRAHLLTEQVDLETHVADVIGTICDNELDEVTLCGHSAGGIVATVVADRLSNRIRHFVCLDATVPVSGQSLMDVMTDAQGVPTIFRQQAADAGDGWRVPPALFSAEDFGVTDPKDAAWVERRMCAHPLRAFEDKAELQGYVDRIPSRTYVRCENFDVDYGPRMVKALDDRGWTVEKWNSAHDIMVTEPEAVCDLLLR